jgi:hypothetical protein
MEPRAYQANAAGTPPVLPATAVSGYPRGASPTLPATTPGPYWFYGWSEEIRNVIIDGGLVPNPRDNSQLYQAIRNIGARHGSI